VTARGGRNPDRIFVNQLLAIVAISPFSVAAGFIAAKIFGENQP
jgi:hypothetical protein